MQRTTQRLSSVGRSMGVAPAAAVALVMFDTSSAFGWLLIKPYHLWQIHCEFCFCFVSLILLISLSAFYVFCALCVFLFARSCLLCAILYELLSLFFFLCLHNKTLCIFAQFRKYLCSLCCCCSSSLSSSSSCYCCSCWFLYLLTVELGVGEGAI